MSLFDRGFYAQKNQLECVFQDSLVNKPMAGNGKLHEITMMILVENIILYLAKWLVKGIVEPN